jgi:Ca2+-dependent lipid-binding protein
MNTFLGVIWGLIDPDMFASVADTLEDVMQASVPGVIENVRVAEINQGNNPFRILSLRALPDGHVKEMKHDIHRQNEKNKDPQQLAADEEGGDYYNLECSFAYYAAPTSASTSEKAKNMHMQLVFYLGIRGLFGVQVVSKIPRGSILSPLSLGWGSSNTPTIHNISPSLWFMF